MTLKLCFSGMGRYRLALLKGIIKAGKITPGDIIVVPSPLDGKMGSLPSGVRECSNIQEAVTSERCNGIIIAHMDSIKELKGIKESITVFSTDPSKPPDGLGNNISIVYYMNNLATEVCKGITVIHISTEYEKAIQEAVNLIFKPLGLVKKAKNIKELFGIQRLVSLSSIGIISYFLYSLGEGFKQIKPRLPDKEIKQSIKQSIQGILEFFEVKSKNDFKEIYKESVIEGV